MSSKLTPTSSAVFAREPGHARFVCEVLAECAAVSRAYNHRAAYQVLRSLSPEELFELHQTWRRGNDQFREAFGPVYHRVRGDVPAGPLFAE
ncbi:MAG: hypothetical protein ACLFS5_01905 [Spirochaetaceae bacterium]